MGGKRKKSESAMTPGKRRLMGIAAALVTLLIVFWLLLALEYVKSEALWNAGRSARPRQDAPSAPLSPRKP